MYGFKIIICTPFEKILLSRLAVSNLFRGVYFENNHEYTLKKKFIEVVWLIRNIFLGVDSNKVENTSSKKFSKAVWLFRTFFGVYILKIIMSNTLQKNSLKLFSLLQNFF